MSDIRQEAYKKWVGGKTAISFWQLIRQAYMAGYDACEEGSRGQDIRKPSPRFFKEC
jgi:hypothetical protein